MRLASDPPKAPTGQLATMIEQSLTLFAQYDLDKDRVISVDEMAKLSGMDPKALDAKQRDELGK